LIEYHLICKLFESYEWPDTEQFISQQTEMTTQSVP